MFRGASGRRLSLALTLAVAAACGGRQKSSERSEMTPKQIVETYKPAIVRIENRMGGQVGVGTGFVVAPDGRIATNLHVIAGGGQLFVRLADGKEFPVRQVVAYDSTRDLAVVQIGVEDLPTVPLGNSDDVAAGDPVVAIGNPLRLDYTVSDGLISSRRPLDEDVILQISAPISQGSSGGPLFNTFGEVIGVATLVSSEGQNLNFAVPINYLQPLLARQGGESAEEFAQHFSSGFPHGMGETGQIPRDVPIHDLQLLEGCSDEQILEVFESINRAIQLGAPVYNKGDHEGCYVIYSQTAKHFEKSESMCSGIREALGEGLETAAEKKSFTLKAWAMRDAFDGLLEVMARKARSGPVLLPAD